MKILLLADHKSPHTKKWVRSFAEQGETVEVFSLRKSTDETDGYYDQLNVKVGGANDSEMASRSDLNKLNYLKNVRKLRKQIENFQPDIINAHYATSYGLLGVLSKGSFPYVISVWGSDIMDFPGRSFLHKYLLRFVLKRANAISCTSQELRKHALEFRKDMFMLFRLELIQRNLNLRKLKSHLEV